MGSWGKGLLLMGRTIPNKKSKPPARVEDKISKLPNEVLCHILSFLPTKYAVRTSILSTRWKNIWAFVPNLDFKYVEAKSYFFNKKKDKSASAGLLTFVDRVISLRGSSDIKKFCLHCSCGSKDFARIDGWIRTAIQHNVVELDLYFDFETKDKDLTFELPQCIFMCKTLVVLKLRSNCITYAPPASGYFLSLKILHVRVEYPDNQSMEKIFSCCRVLEDLTIDGLLGSDDVLNFKISAPELKALRLILPHSSWVGDHDHQYCFFINCPKLENIDLKQDILSKYVFKNAKSLVKASLNLFCHAVADQQPNFSNRANALLAGISNVKYLSLSAHVWEACCVPAFDNLNELKLVLHDCYNWDLLTELLKRSPNLEYLFLEHENDEECICSDKEYSEDGSSKEEYSEDGCSKGEYSEDGCSNAEKWNTPEFVPICLVSHLKTISIRGFHGHLHEREAAKYLLENGEVLRKMTIYTGDFLPAKEKIYKEFSMFQRGSRTCQVEFIEDAGSSFDNDYVY